MAVARWEKIGGHGVAGSWTDETLWINRDLVSDGIRLYASLGGGHGDERIGEVWCFEEGRWRKVFFLENQTTNALGYDRRTRLHLHKGVLFIAAYSLADCQVEIWTLYGDQLVQLHGSGVGRMADLKILGVSALSSSKGGLTYCGLVDNAGVPEPCVIRCGPNGFQNLTADHVPGARDLKANTEIIYCAQEWNDELYIGLYNLNSSKNSGGEIWSFSNTSGWSLSAGRGVRGTWDHRYSDSVLDLEVHNDHLIASLIRKYNTPAEFSSVWKLADGHWLPVELGRSDPDLINATHFNCLKSINGDLYCGVGSVFSAPYIPSTTGVPTVWQVRDTGGWEALVGDGSNGEWESWNFSRPKGVACPYVYSMTAHSGGIVFGTTSRAGGGQSQIWRIDEL
jgi:hypothetical protein